LGNSLFSSTYEYILAYANNKELISTNYVKSDNKNELNKYDKKDENG
jgi:hypothetical protein